MRQILLASFICVSTFAVEFPKSFPKGFDDAQVYARVMKGELVTIETAVGKTQFTTVTRAFFNKASPDAYVKLAVDTIGTRSFSPK